MPFIHKTISILAGSLLMSIGINVFLVNHQLLDGGTFGIGLILHYLTEFPVGMIVIVLSIPVFIFAWIYNRPFFYNSIHGMLFSSFMIDLTYHPLRNFGVFIDQNPLISAILGGLFVGSGIGVMLRFDSSIGGTDLLCQIAADRLKLNPGIVIFCVDFLVVWTGSYFVKDGSFLYSAITVMCVGLMTSVLTMKAKHKSLALN